ncbi:MAG: undecaprenyl-diphosphatase UppP [Actinomycetota bacterium]|nr:undecaprenyl-diphosphatase UppP [Actinomycetota bacterium]
MLRSLVLGVVQGLAEFLPVSSSGHLRLFQEVLGWQEFGVAFDVMLHLATLLAVALYFWRDIVNMASAVLSRNPERSADRRLAWLVIIATVPTGIIGILGNSWFETVPMIYVGVAFLITAAVLTAADRLSNLSLHAATNLSWTQAILVGVAQGIAIMPGISRSGATMAAGLGLGLDREQAARYSFLLSFPIILLAGAKKGLDVIGGSASMPSLMVSAVGFVAAAVTGYVAITGLMRFLRKHTFLPFAVYTAALGIAVIIWQLMS